MKILMFLLCILLVSLILAPEYLKGATYIVTNVNDALPPPAGSLRWAITSANANPGPDVINFNIPGAGPHTIFPIVQLPVLADPAGVLIDGLSEPGSAAGANPPATATLMIVIDGSNTGPAHGIWIQSSFNTIQGLVIRFFEQDGIRIEATIDGTNSNVVYCNFVGTDQTGTMGQGNGWNFSLYWAGVYIICTPGPPTKTAYNNLVEDNLISDNYAEGVGIGNCPPGDVAFNTVLTNYIGTDITGTVDLGNVNDGVYIGEGAHDNLVDGNLISGNEFEGICIVGYAAIGIFTNANIVFNNIIGLDVNFSPLGNTMDGVSIGQYGNLYLGGYAEDNVIDSNTIAYNGHNGVTVWEHSNNTVNADRNQITRNSIYDNVKLGIDLGDNGITYNDINDPDSGANQELNFPVILSATYDAASGQTAIAGTLNIDTPTNQAIVEVFFAIPDPTNYGEGAIYLGDTIPDGAGNWSVTVTGLITGDFVTATTTDMNFNTSEFCTNFIVVPGVEEESSTGKQLRYELKQNYPNPFIQSSVISYQLPVKSKVSLRIFDVTGRHIRNLVTGDVCSGAHTAVWDGRNESGMKVSPGVYFYKLETEDFTATKKLILTR